jgi:5'(3')-deoxyribonucleotidase
MRIGIDIDGCVRDIHAKLVQVYKREMGKDHWCDPPEKWYEYEISKHFSIGDGIWDFWFHAHVEEIYTKALSFPGTNLFSSLVSHGHQIIVLTDQPNPATARYTVEWIYEHLPAKEVHFTSKKYLVPCDIYLDDAPHHLKDFADHDLNYVIMTRRWNIDVPGINGAARINNLYDFKELILKGAQ